MLVDTVEILIEHTGWLVMTATPPPFAIVAAAGHRTEERRGDRDRSLAPGLPVPMQNYIKRTRF